MIIFRFQLLQLINNPDLEFEYYGRHRLGIGFSGICCFGLLFGHDTASVRTNSWLDATNTVVKFLKRNCHARKREFDSAREPPLFIEKIGLLRTFLPHGETKSVILSTPSDRIDCSHHHHRELLLPSIKRMSRMRKTAAAPWLVW